MTKEKKGVLEFKFVKDSVCPHCGAGIQCYRKTFENDRKEHVAFHCGCSLYAEGSTIEEVGMCKNSKEWKHLKEKRLGELEKIVNAIKENVKDEKLRGRMLQHAESWETDIKNWWTS